MKLIILLLVAVAATASADIFDRSKDEHKEYTLLKANKHSVVLRAPRSISTFFRRMIGREKSAYAPSQAANAAAAAAASSPSGVSFAGPFGAASTYYPSYAAAAYAPMSALPGQLAAASGVSPSFATYPMSGNMYAPGPMPGSGYMTAGAPSLAAASSPYAAYSSPVPTNGAGSTSPDFHAVLDSFVRSAGLTPAGSVPNADQEMAASSITSKGDTPVFSFKKLYSFPFYLSSDNAPSTSGFALNIPYMKQHIRRMSIGSVTSKSKAAKAAAKKQKQIEEEHKKKDAALKQIQEQQRLIRALASSEAIASLLQQYLKGDQSTSLNSLSETEKKPVTSPTLAGALSYIQPSLLQQQQQQQQLPQSLQIQGKPSNNYQAFEYSVAPAQSPVTTNDHLMQLQRIRQHLEQQQQQQPQQTQDSGVNDSLSESASLDTLRANAGYNSRVVTHDTQALHEIDPRLYDSSSSSSASSSSSSATSAANNPMYYQHTQVNSEAVKSNSAMIDYSAGDSMDSVRSSSNQDSLSDSGSLNVAESSYRPTIVAYYADPSTHHSSSQSGPTASISKISSSLSPASSSFAEPITGLTSKKDLIISSLSDDSPRTVSLSSSFSMIPRG